MALTMTPTRQPLGCLDSPHMRPMMRSKLNRQNQQNVLSLKGLNSPKNTIFIDSENIEPSSTKRKRTFDDDEENSNPKASRVALSSRISPHITTPKPAQSSTPKSAPIKPAGRSPPPKSSKSASRRSITKPRDLNKRGTKSKPKPKPKAPEAWCFDIHVDTEQEEMTNLMQHSTTVLDISDDEGKPTDSRGKENVPPHESGVVVPSARQETTASANATATRKSLVDRAPLGDLNAADYYADGCNAFSITVVYEDEPEFKKPCSPLSQSQEAVAAAPDPSAAETATDPAAEPATPKPDDEAEKLN
ncbi:uncharacterized protein N7506_007580 [Penicillium brevicompactum]|uniref:uncharacterized protein n=1 Tax=Penicillium brevicompactum TaxID=5074 RepID=UPI0025413CB7|nr:uncharacterized protein N7506_007580 [Penicillium brevicompactum]KAJ5333797.1 hypothetical protein N7506_007580 [Penicillium brevicompactum]